MKMYQSTIEGSWIEFIKVSLTDDQKVLLSSQKEKDEEAKKALLDQIKPQKVDVTEEAVLSKLNGVYEANKHKVKDGEVYQLISADVNEAGKGIINFRVNGEHNQIRF